MRRILHIDASPRDTRSRSRVVAGHFLQVLAGCDQQLRVTRLDLWNTELPALGGNMIEGRYDLIMGGDIDPAIASAWDDVRAVTRDFLNHDAYVISTPMWNFGVPYRLKHLVDVVTQPGMTFVNDAFGNVTGLAKGRRALIVAASAMPFGSGMPEDMDFQLRYLVRWLEFIGAGPVETVRVAPTFGAPETVGAAMAAALDEAERLARNF